MFSALRSFNSQRLSTLICRSFSHSNCLRMNLQEVVSRLEHYAPTSLAEKWDNVGLLVEPTGKHNVQSILLTNDLTEEVLEEAVEKKVEMLIAYHPPIFVPLKRLTSKTFKERIIVKAIEQRIAIYSPHTAFDAVHSGVNDWLASGLGDGVVSPLHHSMESTPQGCTNKVTVTVDTMSNQDVMEIRNAVCNSDHVKDFTINKETSYDDKVNYTVTWCCPDSYLLPSLTVIRDKFKVTNLAVLPLSKIPISMTGSGRLCTLKTPVSLDGLVTKVKNHLNLKHVRLATSHVKSTDCVKTIAICAGSGASVLKGIKADVYLTGEMSHHEVLEAVSRGSHVILCEHSNTERGFLKVFQEKLESLLNGQVNIFVSTVDADPLQVV